MEGHGALHCGARCNSSSKNWLFMKILHWVVNTLLHRGPLFIAHDVESLVHLHYFRKSALPRSCAGVEVHPVLVAYMAGEMRLVSDDMEAI